MNWKRKPISLFYVLLGPLGDDRAVHLLVAVSGFYVCFGLRLRLVGTRIVADAGKQFEEACAEVSSTLPDATVVVFRDSVTSTPFVGGENHVRWVFEVFVVTPDTANVDMLS